MKIWLSEHKKTAWLLLCLLLTLGALLCLWRIHGLACGLTAQQMAERWRGESEEPFAQVSCFVPVDEALSQNQVYAFRGKLLDALSKAALDQEGTDGLWRDAWSAVGKLKVSSDKASGDASVIAVGGDFFSFHPLRLLSGSYLHEDDLMHDRVLLDLELAWLLFGGTDLQGMEVKINDRTFIVAGVIEREDDSASLAAYTAGQGLYMSYDAYAALTESESVTAYEYVLPEPVEGFAADVAKENFPIGRGEVLQNTGRFSYGRLLQLLPRMDERAMQAMGMIYPDWENAARVTENRCARLLLTAILLAVLPLVSLLVWLWKLGGKGKDAFVESVFPRIRDAAEEAVRRPARRRWEKKHEQNK